MFRKNVKLKLILGSMLLGAVIGISDIGTSLTRTVSADDEYKECASGQLCKSNGCIQSTRCCAYTSDYPGICPSCNQCGGAALGD